ncbi:DUF2235 domain-containing protein [Maritimibacter sp. HL-12]|uniref:DUF2235 domain-containing protein n=1 Tax=Maritimibacter sp. HL-12 TaxID=1162418 RepID=UPI000A0EFEAA|nr:DUF2235 domain-containing protein [Maritimibacter sp. HL-12]SMH31214.1 Uncharacterized protein, PA2063/DUF2235 family [Maritimibacter sp. HL-12]
MKRIAIFCDGTWNRADAATPTHVVRLAQAVAPVAADGAPQVVLYIPGVGIGQGVTRLARLSDRIMGGAFGWGLDTRIVEAYRSLIFTFEPGDEVFIFGFSRGAYTARSLAGLIRSAGIPPATATSRIPEAMEMYRARGSETHPNSEASMLFRASLSPDTPTSGQERDWREARGMNDHPALQIAYLGVYDTVGALGLPGFLGALPRLLNRRYAFHDMELSSSVRAARHAVAVDERRRHFPPALWSNLARLNGAQLGAAARYRQEWYPGNHGIVGGSGRVPELSAFATEWIAAGAGAEGLAFRPDRLAALTDCADARADDQGAAQRPAMSNLWGLFLADRVLPEDPGTGAPDPATVSAAARKRLRRTDWRPPTLAPVLDALTGA